MKTYRVNIYQRKSLAGIIESIEFFPLLCVFIVGFISFLRSVNELSTIGVILVSVLIIIYGGLLAVVYYNNRKKALITIKDESLHIKDVFLNEKLDFIDIKGFRIVDEGTNEYLIIYQKVQHSKFFKVRLNKHSEELQIWFEDNFSNLDEEDFIIEEEKILNNTNFSKNREERTEKYIKAHNTTFILNIMSYLFYIWVLFFPRPYLVAVVLSIIYPFIIITIIFLYKGLIKVDTEDRKYAYPTLGTGLFLAFIPAFARAYVDYDLLYYTSSNLWLLVLVIAFALFTIIVFSVKRLRLKSYIDYLGVGMLLVIILAYVYGSLFLSNVLLDKSPPQSYKVKVVRKFKSDEGLHYYLITHHSKNPTKLEKLKVNYDLYEKVAVSDSVQVYLKKGALDIPWYYVGEAKD